MSGRLLVISSTLLSAFVLTALLLPRQQTIRAAERRPAYATTLIRNVPHIRQKPDFCGEACAAMALQHLGHNYDQDVVFNQSGLSPQEARGCYTRELNRALGVIGFDTGQVWHRIRAAAAGQELSQLWKALHDDLMAGVPSIICTRYDQQPKTTEHFRLIVGYDTASDEVVYHEPAVDDGGYRRMARSTMLDLWPLKYNASTWSVIRLRLKPDRIKKLPQTSGLTDADFAQHMMQLKKRIPAKGFHTVIERPFVVIGDESPEMVQRRAAGTIRWSVLKLKKDYFSKDPNHIIDIWLFKDKESYGKHTKLIFNDKPTTPYGYYSSAHRALVMNISTGGGTLVHEIVHPFIASNFPDCPSWFNEGLASLYEQCGEKDGKIHGYTNWRLAGLQRAIRNKVVPSFKELCSTSTREFYRDPHGTNYGQARYLCYYLQQQGKLREFYHRFHRDAAKDPSGLKTLASVLQKENMDDFKKDWEAYVLKLRFN